MPRRSLSILSVLGEPEQMGWRDDVPPFSYFRVQEASEEDFVRTLTIQECVLIAIILVSTLGRAFTATFVTDACPIFQSINFGICHRSMQKSLQRRFSFYLFTAYFGTNDSHRKPTSGVS